MAVYTHIFNRGDGVLFWEKKDYIRFINRFASFSLVNGVSTLAFTVMSTHFHAIVESYRESDVDNLLSSILKSYSTYYGMKYKFPIGRYFETSKVAVSIESLMNELTYVMRNPVHHYICESPFIYPFSSSPYMFPDMMYIQAHWQTIKERTTMVSNLSKRKIREIFGESADYRQNWRVDENGMLLPDSWMNIPKARAVWTNNFSKFLYSMNSRVIDAAREVINTDILNLRGECKSDLEVCEMILNSIRDEGFKSIHQLPEDRKQLLAKSLQMKGVSQDQCCRCLWIEM